MSTTLNWLPAAIISLFSFGLWGLLTKLSVNYIDSRSALLYQIIGIAIVGVILAASLQFKPEMNARGLSFGVLTGIANGIGCLFYFMAANKGKISTVVTMTALYPIITIALAYVILKEDFSSRQGAGIIFALAAIYLLA